MKQLLTLILTPLILALPLASEESVTLTVGAKADVFPMGYIEDAERMGFDIDFAELLAEEMSAIDPKHDYEVEFVTVDTQSRFPMLNSNRVDMLVATVSITDERLRRFYFSDPYYYTHIKLIGPEDEKITGVQDIRGRVIGVLKNSSTIQTVSPIQGSRLLLVDGLDDMVAALEDGTVDAIAIDSTFTPGLLKELGQGYSVKELTVGVESYGVVFSKETTTPAFLRLVNMAIDNLRSDEKLESLAATHGLPYHFPAELDLKVQNMLTNF